MKKHTEQDYAELEEHTVILKRQNVQLKSKVHMLNTRVMLLKRIMKKQGWKDEF